MEEGQQQTGYAEDAGEVSMETFKTQEEGFCHRIKQREYRQRVVRSLWIAGALYVIGVLESQAGPTFLDLQIITDSDVKQASAFFTSHSCGYMTGAALSGLLGEKVNKTLVLFLTLLGAGVSSILTPYCNLYSLMIVVKVIGGVFVGLLDSTANAEHMRLWGNEGRSLMQIIHLLFAIGGVTSPLITRPFLAQRERLDDTLYKNNSGLPENETSHVEDTFASFLMTFVVREFKDVSKSQGAYITAIYWASFACSRFLMIFLAKALSPSHILTLCGCVTFLSFSCFAISVHLRVITGVTVLAAFAGLGMSAVFPSGFSWCESKLLPVTPRLGSGIFLGSSVGAMTNPLLIGYLMEEVSNIWFCYVLLVQVSALGVVFTFLNCFNNLYVIRRYGPLRRKDADLSVENTELCLKSAEG
ncbi:sodium-dependent glucose transporter 1-like [Aplysia californica]|uniref:Sodium-dependent glucose transporter 1-like n=1 Tax=Aplysia californica TaxID=6500 RepID=A0ABM0JK46_APLCA|nr:sodium-dependent glucose transporter 1-like [Aplysia californica]